MTEEQNAYIAQLKAQKSAKPIPSEDVPMGSPSDNAAFEKADENPDKKAEEGTFFLLIGFLL